MGTPRKTVKKFFGKLKRFNPRRMIESQKEKRRTKPVTSIRVRPLPESGIHAVPEKEMAKFFGPDTRIIKAIGEEARTSDKRRQIRRILGMVEDVSKPSRPVQKLVLLDFGRNGIQERVIATGAQEVYALWAKESSRFLDRGNRRNRKKQKKKARDEMKINFLRKRTSKTPPKTKRRKNVQR
ncbi:hypothetical protein KKG83_06450 [Candidatus Micrarchaeota archaeon]|nr:hypothetical protein [Candidatus Micrarchaeota archaeon]